MLKILIVDDEKFIRMGLSKIISEAGEGFEVIGEAENGVQALEFIEVNKPDVIITDIKMPKMNGIELIKNLKIKYPYIKKVVLSGFDEFDFVRETLKNGANDYLLKPVLEDQLIELMIRISKDVEDENEKRLDSLNENIIFNESLPLLKDEFMRNLIYDNKSITNIDMRRELEYYKIKINIGNYLIIIVSLDNYKFLDNKNGIEESKINNFIIRNIAEESVNNITSNVSFFDECRLVIICSINKNYNQEEILKVSGEIFENLKKYSKVRFSLSIGMEVDSFSKIKESYNTALSALKYRFYREESSILIYKENEQNLFKNCTGEIVNDYEKAIKDCIQFNKYENLKSIFDGFCLKLKMFYIYPDQAVKAFADSYMKLQMENIKFKESVAEVFGFSYSYIKELDMFDTLDEIKNYSIKVYTESIQKMLETSGRRDKRIIQLVKAYIEQHYNEEINLNKIAEIVYVNSNYLSELFKSQTGENFVDYFTKVRIEKAKALIKDIRYKTYQVAELVGYDDPAYFSKVFKKVVGVSPKEYRDIVC